MKCTKGVNEHWSRARQHQDEDAHTSQPTTPSSPGRYTNSSTNHRCAFFRRRVERGALWYPDLAESLKILTEHVRFSAVSTCNVARDTRLDFPSVQLPGVSGFRLLFVVSFPLRVPRPSSFSVLAHHLAESLKMKLLSERALRFRFCAGSVTLRCHSHSDVVAALYYLFLFHIAQRVDGATKFTGGEHELDGLFCSVRYPSTSYQPTQHWRPCSGMRAWGSSTWRMSCTQTAVLPL